MTRLLGTTGAIALAVLAYSGQVKALQLMSWVPVDLTLLTGAGVAACVFLLFLASGHGKQMFILLGLWTSFLLPTFMVADTPYGTQKIFTLFTFTLLSAIAPFFVLRNDQQRRVFLATLVILALLFGVLSYRAGALDSLNGAAFQDINPISISRLMGTGAVVLLVLAFAKHAETKWRILMIAVAAGMLLMIFASGRRGPVLAVIVGVVVALAFTPAFQKHRVRALGAGVAALALASWYAVREGSAGAERVLSFLNGEADASTAARRLIWDESLAIISRYSIGVGWGSFPQHANVGWMTTSGGRMYPHNLFLEGYVEGGWLVGTLLMGFIVAAFLRLRRQATTPMLAAFVGLAGFALTNAMVSGDINDQKLMWMTLGLAFVMDSGSERPSTAKSLPAERLGFPTWR